MKTCLICKKDGHRIYRRFRRYIVSNSLHQFNSDTFKMTCQAIAIRKMSGLLFGDLVFNNDNKNKYGYHMECYKNLVAIKKTHTRAWEDAKYKCILDAYVHPSIEVDIFRTPSVSISTTKNQMLTKIKIMGQANKTCRYSTESIKSVPKLSATEVNITQSMPNTHTQENAKSIMMLVTQSESVQSVDVVETVNTPLNLNQKEIETKHESGSEVAKDLTTTSQKDSISCKVRKRFKRFSKQIILTDTNSASLSIQNTCSVNESRVTLQEIEVNKTPRLDSTRSTITQVTQAKNVVSKNALEVPNRSLNVGLNVLQIESSQGCGRHMTKDSSQSADAETCKKRPNVTRKRLKQLQEGQGVESGLPTSHEPDIVSTFKKIYALKDKGNAKFKEMSRSTESTLHKNQQSSLVNKIQTPKAIEKPTFNDKPSSRKPFLATNHQSNLVNTVYKIQAQKMKEKSKFKHIPPTIESSLPTNHQSNLVNTARKIQAPRAKEKSKIKDKPSATDSSLPTNYQPNLVNTVYNIQAQKAKENAKFNKISPAVESAFATNRQLNLNTDRKIQSLKSKEITQFRGIPMKSNLLTNNELNFENTDYKTPMLKSNERKTFETASTFVTAVTSKLKMMGATHAESVQTDASLQGPDTSLHVKLNHCKRNANQEFGMHMTNHSSESADVNEVKRLSGGAQRKLKKQKEPNLPTNHETNLANAPQKTTINRSTTLEEKGSKSKANVIKATGLPIGIRNIYPLSKEEIIMVRDAVGKEIMKEKIGAEPRFKNVIYKPGWILLMCADYRSRTWLMKKVPKVKPWPEAKLSTIFEYQFPRPLIATAIVPNAEKRPATTLLEQLKLQNSRLNTDHWKVHNESKIRGGRLFHLSVDQSSVVALMESNYKVSLDSTKISFRVKDDTNKLIFAVNKGETTVQSGLTKDTKTT